MMQLTDIGKYERLDVLGHGMSGIVYRAKDTLMGRQVALKVVEPETADLEPFFKEARLLARLRHPNIVIIHSSDFIDGKVVVDMELVEGKTLRQLLKDEKQLPKDKKELSLDRVLKIIAQILNALSYAHRMEVIHRDIKPANILIGAEDAVKVVDFGIADVLGTQGYLAGAGTFSHMAPECFLNKSDKRSDIYSVGVILYEMLTGQLPFQADGNSLTAWKETLDKQDRAKPLSEFLPNAPNGLQGILSLALAYDKQKRLQAADAFLDALKRNGLYLLPNTDDEMRQLARFNAAYNRADKHLRQELGMLRNPPGFAEVVRQYAQQHPEWKSERDLLRLGSVRNKLSHDVTEANRFREVPSAADLAMLEQVADGFEQNRGSNPTENKRQQQPTPPVPDVPTPVQPQPPQPQPVPDKVVPQETQEAIGEQKEEARAHKPGLVVTESKPVSKRLKLQETADSPTPKKLLPSASQRTLKRFYKTISLLPSYAYLALAIFNYPLIYATINHLSHGLLHTNTPYFGAIVTPGGVLCVALIVAVGSTVTSVRSVYGLATFNENMVLMALLVALFGALIWGSEYLIDNNAVWTGSGLIAWLIVVVVASVGGLLLYLAGALVLFWLPDDERRTSSVAASDKPGNVYDIGGTSWKPENGYKWLDNAEGDYRVVWLPGSHHKNVVAATRENTWKPAFGYRWVDAAKKDFQVVWMPGKKEAALPNMQADTEEGFWIPAPGYKWLDSSESRFEVVPTVQKSAEHAH